MRRLVHSIFPFLLVITLLIAPAGCKRRKKAAKPADDEPAGLATMVHTADPRSAIQLLRGFYGVENGWRWTAKSFAVSLKPPAKSAATGATLLFKFTLPDVILSKTGPLTLSAHIGDLQLEPEKYSAPGDYTFSRDIPASAMKGEALTVEFMLDKALPPSAQDERELTLIASMIGFEAKQ